MTNNRSRAYLALLSTALIWGIAFPLIKPALSYITALEYLYLRFLVAGLLSLPIFFVYYFHNHPKISYIVKVLLIESIQLISLIALYHGLAKTSALEASLIGSTSPLFVILGGVLWLKERQSRREWQGLALAFFGSSLLILEPLWNGHGFVGSSLVGNLYILFYNLLFMAYALVAKKFYKKKPPLALGSLIYLEAAFLYGLLLDSQYTLPALSLLTANYSVLIAVLYMAIPGSMGCFALYLYAQSKIEVSEASLFTYLNGIFSIPAAFLLLREVPSITTTLAVLLIAWGVYRAEITSRAPVLKKR